MKVITTLACLTIFAVSCSSPVQKNSIEGTWQLLSGTLIENGNKTVTDYTKGKSFIKIINGTHFAFLSHQTGKQDSAFFSAGGGTYTLKDSVYTEHLDYCIDRQWENNAFSFTVSINNDTLVQQGIEKIEGTNVNRLNIEKYVRIKP